LDNLAHGLDVASSPIDILGEVFSMVVNAHSEKGITLPPVSLARLIDDYYDRVLRSVINRADPEEIQARVNIERQALLLDLMSANQEPGTGKRSA
jgi:hypothetical protein